MKLYIATKHMISKHGLFAMELVKVIEHLAFQMR